VPHEVVPGGKGRGKRQIGGDLQDVLGIAGKMGTQKHAGLKRPGFLEHPEEEGGDQTKIPAQK